MLIPLKLVTNNYHMGVKIETVVYLCNTLVAVCDDDGDGVYVYFICCAELVKVISVGLVKNCHLLWYIKKEVRKTNSGDDSVCIYRACKSCVCSYKAMFVGILL